MGSECVCRKIVPVFLFQHERGVRLSEAILSKDDFEVNKIIHSGDVDFKVERVCIQIVGVLYLNRVTY